MVLQNNQLKIFYKLTNGAGGGAGTDGGGLAGGTLGGSDGTDLDGGSGTGSYISSWIAWGVGEGGSNCYKKYIHVYIVAIVNIKSHHKFIKYELKSIFPVKMCVSKMIETGIEFILSYLVQ